MDLAVTTHSACRVCGSPDLRLLIDYGRMPLAGGFLKPDELHLNVSYPLRLARCAVCTLMQILDSVPPEIIFGRYSYASSTTRTLSAHFAALGPELVRQAGAAGRLVVEFGCNDGVLIRPLLAAGALALGVDPSDVALRASRAQGWPLLNTYFDESVAAAIRRERGPARLVVGSNVFAHVNDLHTIVRGATALLDADGLFVVEVHYQGDLLALVQYDTVYHEHTCYHSLASLARLFAAHDLKIVDVQRTPIHSGSIRVAAARVTSARAASPAVADMLAAEAGWDAARFARQVADRRLSLQTLVRDLRRAGRRVAAYGAAGRATVLLNFCGFDPGLVDCVVDMSPLRFGRLVPGALIPIVPPETFRADPPAYAIMTAWNYEAEILAREADFVQAGGRFIVPLPEVRLAGAS